MKKLTLIFDDVTIRAKDGTLATIHAGQTIHELDGWCGKTGLRKDDGSMEFADWGWDMTIEIVGGKHDGFVGWVRDSGGWFRTDQSLADDGISFA